MVSPMGEELVVVAGRAQARYLDLMDAQSSQLQPVGFPQVKVAGTVPLLVEQLGLLWENLPDQFYHIFTDLITAGANGRPNTGDEICRAAAVGLHHSFDRLLGRLAESAFPSGVSQTYSPPDRIVEGDRHAIGEAEHEKYTGTIGDQSVGLEGDPAPILWSDHSHIGTVHLVGRDDVAPADAQGPADEVIVGVHGLLVIAHRFAHIQPVVRRAAEPTQPAENPVDDLTVGCQAVETIVKKTVVFLSQQGSVPFKLTISVTQKGRKSKLGKRVDLSEKSVYNII
jgi:hypothetical protein